MKGFFGVLPLLFSAASCLSSAGWRSQSIYQVITDRFAQTSGSTTASCSLGDYCGGTWQGLINKLDYIQNMGFTAVWISPVVSNIDTETPYGRPYHGYWAQDIYSLNYHFGATGDLQALSQALHARGMYLMVDVVTNHMAYNGGPNQVQYSTLTPFNSQSYYHSYCPIDSSNITSVEYCWTGDTTVALPDLKTESSSVQNIFNSWISDLVSTYNIDGLRIDSAMEVNQGFFPSFVSSAGVYAVGEVLDGNPYTLCPYQNYMPGMLNYAAFFWITRVFESNSATFSELAQGINTLKSSCSDTTLLGNFLENQDNPRFASITTDQSLTKNAIAYNFFSDGIPIVYYGQEQGFSGATDPNNREPFWPSGYNTGVPLYTWISKLNTFRKYVISKDSSYVTSKASVIQTNTNSIVTSKGSSSSPVISVFTNGGAGSTGSGVLTNSASGLPNNFQMTDIVGCTVYTTSSTGTLSLSITNGLPLILYSTEALSGSGICGHPNIPTTSMNTVVTSKVAAATSTKSTPSSTKSTSNSGATCSVTFTEKIATAMGDSIKMAGSNSQLGKWASGSAVAMSASGYTSSNPVWSVTVPLPAGSTFQYKFIHFKSGGTVVWEDDPNRSYTVPNTCSHSMTVAATWQ